MVGGVLGRNVNHRGQIQLVLTAQNTQAAKDLNDGGYKTSNGKLWHKSFFSIESKTSSKTDTSNDKCWYLS